MKYTVYKTEYPGIFAVKDENGLLIADTFSRDIAEQIAALPKMIELLKEGMRSEDAVFCTKCTQLVKRLNL